MSIFEQAARQKIRFATNQGMIATEDLWDLPLTHSSKANLDDIAKDIYRQLKATDLTVSFVKPVSAGDATLQLKFDLVKHIIDVRVAERDTAAAAAKVREQKQKIMSIIAQKEDEKLSTATVEELQAMLSSMN